MMALFTGCGSLVTQCLILIILVSDKSTNAFSIGKLRTDGLAVDTGQDMTAQESSTYIVNRNQNDSDKRVLDYLNSEFRNNTTATNIIEINKPAYEINKDNNGENVTEPMKKLETANQLVDFERIIFNKGNQTYELNKTAPNNEDDMKLSTIENGFKTVTEVDSQSSYPTLPVREPNKYVEQDSDQSTLASLHSDTKEVILKTDAETPSKSDIKELFPIKKLMDDAVLPDSTPTLKQTIVDRTNDQQDSTTINYSRLDALDTFNSFNFSENMQETRLQKDEFFESSSLPSDLFETKEDKIVDNHAPVSEVSKRGGFLDLSSKTTTGTLKLDTSTTESTTLLNKVTNPQSSQTGTKDSEFKKNRSRTQMSDDAIKEALMIEELHETLNNLADSINKEDTTQGNSLEVTERKSKLLESSTEDRLSVKPIGKNSSIYTVNPNYKPLKKLDVMPSKQFLRDPDDNSWRNESISSLGIVFNPKNASKPLTEVLKNKTESEFGYLIDNDDTLETPELRARLEKLAEERKSKKKNNKKGDTNENDEMDLVLDYFKDVAIKTSEKPTTEMPFFERLFTVTDPTSAKPYENSQKSKLKKTFKKLYDFYDSSDEGDDDYATLANIDIKKSHTTPLPKTPAKTQESAPVPLKPPVEIDYVQPLRPQFPERKPSVQYFPPRGRPLLSKLDAVDEFQDKMIQYTLPDIISSEMPTTKQKEVKTTTTTTMAPFYINKNYFDANSDDNESPDAPYVIKQFKDSIIKAETERQNDFNNRNFAIKTATPKINREHGKAKEHFSLDLGKDIMERFFENYHENNDKFKVDYPVVFNNTVVHSKWPNGGQSSSRAFMKQALGGSEPCDKAVDLSPDYELHYYIPEQEEREEIQVPT